MASAGTERHGRRESDPNLLLAVSTDGYATGFAVGAAVFAITAIIGALVLPARLGERTAPGDVREASATDSSAAAPSGELHEPAAAVLPDGWTTVDGRATSIAMKRS